VRAQQGRHAPSGPLFHTGLAAAWPGRLGVQGAVEPPRARPLFEPTSTGRIGPPPHTGLAATWPGRLSIGTCREAPRARPLFEPTSTGRAGCRFHTGQSWVPPASVFVVRGRIVRPLFPSPRHVRARSRAAMRWPLCNRRRYDAGVRGQWRVEDAALERTEVWRGEDASPDFDAAPWVTFSGASHEAALSASHDHRLVARRRNRWNLLSQNVGETIVRVAADGSEEPTPPSGPFRVACSAAASGAVRVQAHYAHAADGALAASKWLLYQVAGGGEPDVDADAPTIVDMVVGGGIVRLDRTAGAYSHGQAVKTLVRTRRLDADPQRDLTAFTEIDTGGYLTVTADRVHFAALPNTANSRLLRDWGSAIFDDYEYDFTAQIDAAAASCYLGLWGLTDKDATWQYWTAGQLVYLAGAGGSYSLYLRDIGSANTDSVAGLSLGTPYYCTARRTATLCELAIYTDEARRTLLDLLSVACATDPLSHEYACVAYGGAPAATATGFVECIVHREPVDSENSESCEVTASTEGPEAPDAAAFFPGVAEQR